MQVLKLNLENTFSTWKKGQIDQRNFSRAFIEKWARMYVDKKWRKFMGICQSAVSSYLMKEINFSVSYGEELSRTLFEFGSTVILRSRRATSSRIRLARDLLIGPSGGSGLASLRVRCPYHLTWWIFYWLILIEILKVAHYKVQRLLTYFALIHMGLSHLWGPNG